jgi:hypothetical protein
VLALVERDLPELVGAPWRDRATEREWLTTELRRRLDLAARGAAPTDQDLARVGALARAAARRGAPLVAVQRFLRATVAHSLTELWARAEPEDVTELLRLSRWIAQHNGALERLLVGVYCEQLDPGRERADRHGALAERLLAGLDPDHPVPASHGCLVLAFEPGEPPDGPVAAPAGWLCATVEQLRHAILLVGTPRAGGGPAAGRDRDEVWRAASLWVTRRGPGRAAGVFADATADIPAAAGTARRLVRASAAVGLPPGLVGPEDLVLETVLTARADHAHDLVALLDPLDVDPRLLETLTAFYLNDLDRTRTAAELLLSRGGLALRLDRVAQLTGLDPRSTRGIQVLGAALAARALAPAGDAAPAG